jgi:hypothetical protein
MVRLEAARQQKRNPGCMARKVQHSTRTQKKRKKKKKRKKRKMSKAQSHKIKDKRKEKEEEDLVVEVMKEERSNFFFWL